MGGYLFGSRTVVGSRGETFFFLPPASPQSEKAEISSLQLPSPPLPVIIPLTILLGGVTDFMAHCVSVVCAPEPLPGCVTLCFPRKTRPLLTVSQSRRQAVTLRKGRTAFRIQATWTTREAPFVGAARASTVSCTQLRRMDYFGRASGNKTNAALFVRQHICRVSAQLRRKGCNAALVLD